MKAIEFLNVSKKFRKGENFDSLRDFIPSLTRAFFGQKRKNDKLDEKTFWALKNVSFEVKKGECLGIIGPNGSGKSTTLKLLSKILKPTAGEIRINGRLSALIEVGAGFHPDLTGRENIYLNGSILGMRRKEIDAKIDSIIEFSELQDFIDTPVKRYSSGMYVRLGFAVAAHMEPEILLIDEVLAVGDMNFQSKCIEKIRSLIERNTTIVFISHNLQLVQLICKKTILLKKGRIAVLSKTSDAIAEYLKNPCVSCNENNKSDKSVNIDHVTLLDDYDKESNEFRAGDKAVLKFNICVDRPLNEYLLGFLVNRTADGLLVCDYNLPLISQSFEKDDKKEESISLNFQLNLLRGLYSLTLHLYHKPSGKHVYWGRNLCIFSVDERLSYEGISFLNPLLNLTQSANYHKK